MSTGIPIEIFHRPFLGPLFGPIQEFVTKCNESIMSINVTVASCQKLEASLTCIMKDITKVSLSEEDEALVCFMFMAICNAFQLFWLPKNPNLDAITDDIKPYYDRFVDMIRSNMKNPIGFATSSFDYSNAYYYYTSIGLMLNDDLSLVTLDYCWELLF